MARRKAWTLNKRQRAASKGAVTGRKRQEIIEQARQKNQTGDALLIPFGAWILRGRYPILLPGRVYAKYTVAWNQGAFLANEDFIEVKPHWDDDMLPLLAALNSSFSESMVRTIRHVYGGGVCNLNPNDVKAIPVLNVNKLGSHALCPIVEAK